MQCSVVLAVHHLHLLNVFIALVHLLFLIVLTVQCALVVFVTHALRRCVYSCHKTKMKYEAQIRSVRGRDEGSDVIMPMTVIIEFDSFLSYPIL